MFLLLTRVFLWLLVGFAIYYLLIKLIPNKFLTIFGGLAFIALIFLAFLNPQDGFISTAWTILSIPLKPIGLTLLLLILGLAPIKFGADIKAPKPYFIWAAFIVLLLSSLPVFAYQMAQLAERDAITVEQRTQEALGPRGSVTPFGQQRAEAIVLLGEGTTQANLPYRTQIQLTESGDRILYTADLYGQQRSLGSTPIVIVSAGPRSNLKGDEQTVDEARDISILLQKYGVPASQIVPDNGGGNLRSSALSVKDILSKRGLVSQPIILVSSGINIRRAQLTFEREGLNVLPRPTDFYTFESGEQTPQRRIRLRDFLPSAEALVTTTRVVEEYLSSLFYFLRGWLNPVQL
ncbi:MAG: YdcF family protein [Spirulinaceae cyanobacterium]